MRPGALTLDETFGRADAPYNMENPSAGVDDLNLQLARQLYDRCMELYGEDHEETRLLGRYKSQLENRDCPVHVLHS
jgi:hypothetical protein